MADIFDLVTLAGIQRRIKTAPRFWLNEFYKRQINFEQDYIMFDRVYEDHRALAPFVVPNVAGRPGKLAGFETDRFKPAYSKQKDIVDYTMHMDRQAGESLGGSLSIAQRRDAVKAYLLQQQKEKLQNTFNWLAARATIDGKVTISGEDYPETLVDFRRHANLTITLTGAAKWDQATAKPLDDLKDARIEANGQSGARIKTVIFGANAWELFTQRVDLKDILDTRYLGLQQSGVTRLNALTDGYPDSIEYMGRLAGVNGQGAIDCWVDTTRFINPETGLEEFYLDQNTVCGVAPDAMGGTRCFGAIKDIDAGFLPMEFHFKNWIIPDPSQEYLLTQSAPLMVPRDPNATYSMKVA
jgi:hypothetical protein